MGLPARTSCRINSLTDSVGFIRSQFLLQPTDQILVVPCHVFNGGCCRSIVFVNRQCLLHMFNRQFAIVVLRKGNGEVAVRPELRLLVNHREGPRGVFEQTERRM